MEHHAFLYRKEKRSLEEAQVFSKNNLEAIIYDFKNRIDIYGKDAKDVFTELESAEIEFELCFKLQACKRGDAFAIWTNQIEEYTYYNPITKDFYIRECVIDSLFGSEETPSIKLFSLKECIEWLSDEKNQKEYKFTPDKNLFNYIGNHWMSHPEGMIYFM